MKKFQMFTNLQKISHIFRKKLFVILSLISVILGLFSFPIGAQTEQEAYLYATPWYETNGNRVRIAINQPSLSETRNGIIEVVLKPKWKTYWRNPGNSGMAPFFTFDQPVSYEIFYPTPQLYEIEDNWSFSYTDKVVLPFTVSGSSKNLSGSLTIGICDTICIPFIVDFNFSPSSQKNEHIPSSLLTHAQAALPRTMHNEFKISAEKDFNTLFIKIQNNRKITHLSIFLDGGDMQIGPAKRLNDHEEYTFFTAPIYFDPDEPNQTVFYTVSSKSHALSGTFTISTQSPSTPLP
ncbi:protein-disulfide reductase DsbD domain-containing protein [Bartonella sp. A05]|uniref:protein-disulfide reductase DsbD domain-containing protein n=1 Tax=Bartonella sp. A05 TaxID=2967261 RepID=UPI0022A9937C|nr:protein-disulfide reductase DsbD domain-containing protein [Bartonella sp. A05]MCZ2203873.1 protein-disulfide reductase DsbD family protein [Bartonella sp. A05]